MSFNEQIVSEYERLCLADTLSLFINRQFCNISTSENKIDGHHSGHQK